MTVQSVTAHRIGPFYEEFSLPLDPRVTILTGANDVGKSSCLRIIDMAMTTTPIDESFVNQDHLQESPTPWTNDDAIYTRVCIELTDSADLQGGLSLIAKGDRSLTTKLAAPGLNRITNQTITSHYGSTAHAAKMPEIITSLSTNTNCIRDEIDLRQPNQLEQAILDAAFESKFTFAKLEALKPLNSTRSINAAQSHLNELLERILPKPGSIKFELRQIEGDRSKLAIFLRDRHDGMTPLGNRGSGVRRLITLISELLTYQKTAHHRLILLDEPETSLHADAQHLLREFLFDLTNDGKTQIVYATHSPSMINPLRDDQLRLLVREKHEGRATTRIQVRPTHNSFFGLRTSLGVTASDSLLYGPVTVITEGETEVRCLLPLLRRALEGDQPGLAEAEKLLGLCHFLSGGGDSYEYMSRLAKSQGTQVVLFLDGDKRRKYESLDGVSIIFTPGQSEFEDLLPAATYIQAAVESVGISFEESMLARLQEWTENSPKNRYLAFSKRVEGWFRSAFEEPFQSKPKVMLKAIELVKGSDIDKKPLLELLEAIRQALQNTSFE